MLINSTVYTLTDAQTTVPSRATTRDYDFGIGKKYKNETNLKMCTLLTELLCT